MQSVSVPASGGDRGTRDLVSLGPSEVALFAGTFNPRLSRFDGSAWTHDAFTDWGTANNVSYGGIAASGQYLFVSDNLLGDDGLVRFDRSGGPTMRSAVNRDAIDVAFGLDGFVYTLNGTGSPDGRTVTKYDPTTLNQIGSDVNIGGISSANRGLAVDADGSLFIVTWDGRLVRTDPAGNEIATLTLTTSVSPASGNAFDIDLRPNGKIVVGHRFGAVNLTDRSFSTHTAFQTGQSNHFVAFVVVPEPSTIVTAMLATACLAFFDRQRNRT